MRDKTLLQVRRMLQRQLVDAILSNERIARKHRLRVTDLQTLHLLVLRDDIRTPHEIIDATGMPPSTVTKLIDRLERSGYVRRKYDRQDRRRIRLELVAEAIAPLQSTYGRTEEEFDKISRRLSDSELEVVIRFLESVSAFALGDALNAQSRDTSSRV
ncbi:MarR family transcriptional regulator [Leucobacter sp. M11]|nr:MarR family transcriptional regulator [Leucobacter sp. M11]